MKHAAWLARSLAPVSLSLAQTRSTPDFTAKFRQVVEALQTRDTVTLSGIYANGYTFAIGGGDSVTTLSRAERLQSIAASNDSISTLNLERCDFDRFGATAVGPCWIRQPNIEGRHSEWVGIYTTVIFNRTPAGRWQLVASHARVNRPKRRTVSP
ncbi:MAG: nuclear transport factor 2 family protein [Gemmatimonadetes bacterium]|nr:nuclear transport factor 2 family protein [Gemmatimonadota bacterium]